MTHESRPDLHELNRILEVLARLGDKLGPFMVQLPASVDARGFERLEPVFEHLTVRHRFVIEVRHQSWFSDPEWLEPRLERYGAGRVMLDSRPIYQGERTHPEVRYALHDKPNVPVLAKVYGGIAFVRLVLHPDIVSNDVWLDFWVDRAAGWLGERITTYMMIHCPNNLHCPPLALDFHERLKRKLNMPGLATWPVPEQQSLF